MIEGDPNVLTSAGSTTNVSHNKTGLFSKRVFPLVLGAALFASFPTVWLGAETFFFRDFGAQVYPALYYLRQSILSGEIPLWNPYNHCGLPFMAQWSYWYPGNLIIVLLPVPWSANLFLLVHLFLGGSGMYWLCRRLGVGGFAASFAGMAYVFN